MKTIIFSLGILFSAYALAAPNKYDINFDLALDGKHLVSAKVKATAGKKSTLVQENDSGKNIIDLVATEENGAIFMNFTISQIGKNGEKKVLSKPSIVARENERAKIEMGQNNSDAEHMSLSVLAKKSAM